MVFSDPHPELCRSVITTDRFAYCKEADGYIYTCTEIYIHTLNTCRTQFSYSVAFEVIRLKYSAECPDLLGHDTPPHTHAHLLVVTLKTRQNRAGKRPMTGTRYHIIMTHKKLYGILYCSSTAFLPSFHVFLF